MGAVITLGCWLRNLFTDEDGEWSDDRWVVFTLVFGVLLFVGLMYVTRSLPATSPPSVTVTVNDPGGAPVIVVVNQP